MTRYYIVFSYEMVHEITWPDSWGYQCVQNLAPMLKEKLKAQRIASEIKLIWNYEHRRIIMNEYNVTSEQIDSYLASRCNMLAFKSLRIRDRAYKELKKMGAVVLVTTDNYRDVILQQVFFKENKRFNIPTEQEAATV